MKKILFIEDNKEYRSILKQELIKNNYLVDEVADPLQALAMIAKSSYDLILSGLHLPHIDGIRMIKTMKEIIPKLASIILTSDPDEKTELQAIDNCIDYYISKDKAFSVILKYIEITVGNLENRCGLESTISSKVENIIIDLNEHIVTKDDIEIDLTPKEFELLLLFLTNKNKVLSRNYLIDKVWTKPTELVESRLVDSHIKKLRNKLSIFSIATVRGYGYRWNEIDHS